MFSTFDLLLCVTTQIKGSGVAGCEQKGANVNLVPSSSLVHKRAAGYEIRANHAGAGDTKKRGKKLLCPSSVQ